MGHLCLLEPELHEPELATDDADSEEDDAKKNVLAKTDNQKSFSQLFQQRHNELIHKYQVSHGVVKCMIDFTVDDGLDDACHGCYDIQSWLEIQGLCNYDQKLENLAKGMKIKGKFDRSKLNYKYCTQGTFFSE